MVRWYVFRGSRYVVVKWYFRDVELLGVPENGLEDFFIISDLDDSYQNGHLAITGKFWQDKGQQVQLELMDQQGKTVLKETVAGNQGTVEFSASLPSVTAWSAEKPYLYQLFITVFSEGKSSKLFRKSWFQKYSCIW